MLWTFRLAIQLLCSQCLIELSHAFHFQPQREDDWNKHILIGSLCERGHFSGLSILSSELLNRGFFVTFVIPIMCVNWMEETHANLTVIASERTKGELARLGERSKPLYDAVMAIEEKRPIDFLIGDYFAFSLFDAAEKLRITSAAYTQFMAVPPFLHDSYRFPFMGVFSRDMNVLERLASKLMYWAVPISQFYLIWNLNNLRSSRGLPKIRSTSSYFQERLCFSMGAPPLFPEGAAYPPIFLPAGPLLSRKPRPLSQEVSEWLDSRSSEVIFVSMGTVFQYYEKFLDQLSVLMNSLLQRELRVLMSTTEDKVGMILRKFAQKFEGEDKRVLIRPRVAQRAVLQHEKVKVFLTHAGANSILESLEAKVPMMALPQFWDQAHNSLAIERLGVGVQIYVLALAPKDHLMKRLHEVFENYDNHVRNAHRVWDLVTSQGRGEELVANAIEYGIKYGYEHLHDQARFSSHATDWQFILVTAAVWVPLACWLYSWCFRDYINLRRRKRKFA